MVRTLRKDCPSCGQVSFYIEGRRRASCFYCGAPILLPPSRGQVLVDFICPACATVSEVEDAANVASCPGCRRSFALARDPEPQRFCVRDTVSRERAERIARDRGRGTIEDAALSYVPYWLYQAVELGWVLGNEKLGDPGHKKGRGADPGHDDPAREAVAPVGGKLEYTKKEMSRAVREYLADPAGEGFGWKAVAKHTEGASLAPLDASEIAPGARLLKPEWTPDAAAQEGARRTHARPLVDERHFYRFFDHRVLLRETLAIVFHPFWVLHFDPPDVPGRESIPRDWMIVDAVAGEVTREPQAGGPPLHRLATEEPPARPRATVELACPECKAPFGRSEPAALAVCESCLAAWSFGREGLTRVEARFVVPQGVDENDGERLVYLPIWRYRVKIRADRKELANRAQWKRFTRPVEVTPQPADAKRSIVFYSLAGGPARAARLDALSLALTRLQPDLRFGPPQSRRALPAVYGAEDASRLAFSTYLTLFRDLTLKSIDGLKRTHIEAGEAELIFYPCVSRRGEVRDARLGVTLQMGSSWDAEPR